MAPEDETPMLSEEQAVQPVSRGAGQLRRVGLAAAGCLAVVVVASHGRLHGVPRGGVTGELQELVAVKYDKHAAKVVDEAEHHSKVSTKAKDEASTKDEAKAAHKDEASTKAKAHTTEATTKATTKAPTPAPTLGPRSCKDIPGVQVAEPDAKTQVWKPCSAKWTEDCSEIGCCAEPGMKCYRKSKDWATCKADCSKKDAKNETWSCDVITPPEPRSVETCFAACKESLTCGQAIFNGDNGATCSHAKERLTDVAWASDAANSTFCGPAEEQDEVQEAFDKIFKQLPFQMPAWPLINCSWGGEDCSKTKCCNDYQCDKDYNNCGGFSCYQKTEYFSGCAASPPGDWDGTWIGGPREHRLVPPAASQVAVQGTSLYCFTVVTWESAPAKPFWDSEADIANLWKGNGLHVLQCDGHDIVDGAITPKAEWGSFSNIDLFMDVWKRVSDMGRWKNYDWTVKVDSDAVFIPSRLKDHLYNLRTPHGARVYLENINFKFKFMGALEIMSKDALAVFLELGHTCIRGEHAGGEDSFLKGCMNALGVDHQSDYQLLRDKYAKLNGPCTDGWSVAYHYMKKVHDWASCYNEVMCGNPGWGPEGKCAQAIDVPSDPR